MASAEISSRERLHIVFVPGFGGFDALGQIEYYPGTAGAAERWRALDASGAEGRDRVALHYFDNLPTAGVRTRAERLKRFLLKRCERNEFQRGDKLALIGHSTGGLDIRALLLELKRLCASSAPAANEDGETWRWERENALRLSKLIKALVFMSVPQRGTNIADWARSVGFGRKLLIRALHGVAERVDDAPFEGLQATIAAKLNELRLRMPRDLNEKIDEGLPDLWTAVADLVSEAEQRGSDDPVRAAAGREALGELNLWLGHTHGDFLAIDDLSCIPPDQTLLSRVQSRFMTLVSAQARSKREDVTFLARALPGERKQEQEYWQELGIRVLSFATRAKPPHQGFRNGGGLLSYWALTKLLGLPFVGRTDGPFRLVFAACASGPFHRIRAQIRPGEADYQAGATQFPSRALVAPSSILSWHNDGIVNTASMLWPSGKETLLVEADHGDIVGHYEQNRPNQVAARKYRSYDIFGSDSGFDDALFDKVWFHAFDHCLKALDASAPLARK